MTSLSTEELRQRAREVEMVVLDVDGVLTDGGLFYGPEGELFIIYFVMALVLVARPKGLFSAPEARKI